MYNVKLKFDAFQIRKLLLGICIDKSDALETYPLRSNQKVKNFDLCSEASTSEAKRLAKMTDEQQVFYLLHGIPRNDDWRFFVELMMDKNATATLVPDEIVINLIEKESTIKHEKGQDRKPYCSPKKTPKEIAKPKAEAGRAVKEMRAMRIRIASVNRCVTIPILNGIMFRTTRT